MVHYRKKHTILIPVLVIALFAGLLLLFVSGVLDVSEGTTAREKETLEKALARDITSRYVVTGRYPESLDEIRETCGLVYDEDTFYIDYQVRGANIRPDYTVLVREGG